MEIKKTKLQKYLLPLALILIAVGIGVAVLLAVSGSGRERDVNVSDAVSADYPLRVDFVDVGQGDGILIRCGDSVIVIDGGEPDVGGPFVSYLKNVGVSTVSCYIASHPHVDHIGAAAAVFAAFDVQSMWTTAFSELNTPTVSAYEDLLTAAANEPGCEVRFVAAGEEYDIGELHLQIFAPVTESTNHNDMSIVVRLTYGDVSFLFTGDTEAGSEQAMLDAGFSLRSDVLKVAHHGSSSSTTEAFLSAVDPAAAVISCGTGNAYGHPHREVLQRLEDAGISIYRTDTDGSVTLFSDGKDLFVRRMVR